MTTSAPMNQGMIEHLTGFSREVLRKWELRYGFPVPSRGARGQRLYTHADVDRLLLIRRLLQTGLRPAQIVGLCLEDLQAHVDALKVEVNQADSTLAQRIEMLYAALDDPVHIDAVQALLSRWLYLDGPLDFACETLGCLNAAIGQAWSEGRLSVHQEHWYAECMRRVLNLARAGCVMDRRWSRVLLTTPPGEAHELALLGLELALATQGVDVLYLGAQTPVDELCRAASRYSAGVIGLSVSISTQALDFPAYLETAQTCAPPDCEIWLGGDGASALQPLPERFKVFGTVRDAVLYWQRQNLPA